MRRYLFPDIDPGQHSGTTDESIVTTSGKMLLLDALLPRLQKAGHKVLIFSQMTQVRKSLHNASRAQRMETYSLKILKATGVYRTFNIPRSNSECLWRYS